MPSEYYDFRLRYDDKWFQVPYDERPTVHVRFGRLYDNAVFTCTKAVSVWQVIVIDTVHFTSKQQVWLEQTLANSPGDYTIVVGHYPVYSDGPSGDVLAVTALPDLLKQYGVSVYISGHDESLQHLVVSALCLKKPCAPRCLLV
jgi:tartrate-resistant acid phosphatase type 5